MTYKIKGLVISFKYAPEHLKRNGLFVLTILAKSDNKIKSVAVVERPTLQDTIDKKMSEYPLSLYTYLLSTTAIVGEFLGYKTDTVDDGRDDDAEFSYGQVH